MKTNSCIEITDPVSPGCTGSRSECRSSGFIIPSGVLIGLGVGIFTDQVFPGFLVGLGLGFLGSGLLPLFRKPQSQEGKGHGSTDVTAMLFGAFLVFTGTCIVFAPAVIWPYGIAAFLTILGTWLLVQGLYKTS
jgi:hypothetical protein